jgi:hypothetical protein
MKKNFIIFVAIALGIVLNLEVEAQIRNGAFNPESGQGQYLDNNQLLFINDKPFEDLRVHNAGTKGIVIMGLLPIDLPGILDASDTTDNKLDNRLPETVFPNFRYYTAKNNCLTIGLVYAKTAHRYEGETLSIDSMPTANIYEYGKKSKLALRVANDRHFKPFRLRALDIDPYIGASLSLGYSPIVRVENVEYSNGDYTRLRTKSNYMTIGIDGYVGVNFMFERFSFGAELMAIGADFQKGAGKEKVVSEQQLGGQSSTQEYLTSSKWNTNEKFSKLKISDNQVSMYKGVRFVFAFYLDNFND